jgi:hypothetical protein
MYTYLSIWCKHSFAMVLWKFHHLLGQDICCKWKQSLCMKYEQIKVPHCEGCQSCPSKRQSWLDD